ncbi:hypothetical protein HELRODRAFT_181404 [Helobdella robusta]|uniref:Uncharacterized protein n=1 Tax=Helobdella robusta TaxID=6412 RepID=T1FGZ0_HELRO|nr:hypothetical protein HELRODRAFT_181404 [Helobdella robusta]ESN92528.1 hypothetical protein HELRODRAFT_181404 [Helobdella robusta]
MFSGSLVRIFFSSSKRYFNKLRSDVLSSRTSHTGSLEFIQRNRRLEALRSVLFVYSSSQTSLLEFCQNYGRINSVFFFTRFDKQYSLIEFNDEQTVGRLLSHTSHFPNKQRIPLKSHCLFFQYNFRPNRHQKNFINSKSLKIYSVENFGVNELSDELLATCPDIESQMKTLYRMQSMSMLDVKLRYFLAAEVERLVGRLFPDCQVHLFGSSVSGLGRFNGDVDMNLTLENMKPEDSSSSFNTGPIKSNTSYFISKIRPESERTFSQQVLEIFGTMLKYLCPQMMNIRLILRARVPIVKFTHTATDIECDLCFGNMLLNFL